LSVPLLVDAVAVGEVGRGCWGAGTPTYRAVLPGIEEAHVE
jgi:hypothetical protein